MMSKKSFDNLKAEIDDRDQQLLKEKALQNERKTEIIMFKIEESYVENQEDSRKYDMSEIQKTLKEVCKIEETDNGRCHLSGIPLQKGFFPLSQRDFYFINCC
jgi:hypothetical protein